MRLGQVVEANVAGIHAYQCRLARTSETADKRAWGCGALGVSELDALVAHHYALLAEKPAAVRDWVEGRASTFDPARDLTALLASPLKAAASNLPVNVLAARFQEKTGARAVEARAIASLLQMQLDVARDADRLQELYALYAALGLPVHTARLGLAARTDADFLAIGRALAPQMCASPFDTSPDLLQMMLRKMWNWGHRHTGERDKRTLAREMLREPAIASLVPKLKGLPPQRIAVIGHSYTMNVHWSSPSASVPIAAEILAQAGAKAVVRQWQAGGMSAGRDDCRAFYREALAWKPDRVLFVVAVRGAKDEEAIAEMAAGLVAAGARVAMFDSLYGSLRMQTRYYPETGALAAIARRAGMALIPVAGRIDASPDHGSFLSLDGIHMTEPYHRLLAQAWLEHLAE
jgi:hypothetical protein